MTTPTDLHQSAAASTSREPAAVSSGADFLRALGAELAFIQDATGLYQGFYWQEAQRYGLSAAEIVGRPMSEAFAPANAPSYLAQVRQVLDSRQPRTLNCHFSDGTGTQSFPFELVISPVLRSGETLHSVLVMGRSLPLALDDSEPDWPKVEEYGQSSSEYTDVREPKDLELCGYLLDTISHSKLLTQVARQIRHALDFQTIWQQTVKGLGSVLQVSRCLICPYPLEHLRVRVVAEYMQPGWDSWLGREFELEEYPEIQQALTLLEPVEMDTRSSPGLDQPSGLLMATSEQGQPNGLIVLFQCDGPRQWHPTEIEMVRELADQVGTAIAHATLYQELEEARRSAEEVSRLKSNFLANTSHELRTPLNGILGFLKLILDGMADDPQEQIEFIQEAYRSAEHLLNIINDILDIAKIESGKMQLDLEPVKLRDLLHHLKSFTQAQVQQKRLYFQIQLPSTEDEIIIFGNYQRLLQILLNLVGNAIKFTHEGGITITSEVLTTKLRFNGRTFPGMVRIQVADTGIGVSLDQQDKLFQNFTQIDGSRTRQYGGTGLGLAISQKLVESMGGVVHFYSMGEGLGATVTFTVPLFQELLMLSNEPIDSFDFLIDP